MFASATIFNTLDGVYSFDTEKFCYMCAIYFTVTALVLLLKVRVPAQLRTFLVVNDTSNGARKFLQSTLKVENSLHLGFLKSVMGTFSSNGVYSYMLTTQG